MNDTKDRLGDRMKGYENVYRTYVEKGLPVIIRIDGKSFHTVTKKCQKPFDDSLISVMDDTAIHLCKNIPGARLAYVQSDEISILVVSHLNAKTQPWFDNNLQKMVSISASLASVKFSLESNRIFGVNKPIVFDSRAFVVPENEVSNYFIWRQQDCIRNSIQMLARSIYSHSVCSNKNCSELKDMCAAKDKCWDELDLSYRRGRCIIKMPFERKAFNKYNNNETNIIRNEWVVDNSIPQFTFGCDYINKYLKKDDVNDS